MFTFLLVVHVIVATALVGVILMQRSEGGGLTGGSPSGLMSARGAADFLTRTTTILAVFFVVISIALAFIATVQRGPSKIDTSLSRDNAATAPATTAPLSGDASGTNAAAPVVDGAAPIAPAPVQSSPVPLAVPAAPVPAPAAKTPAAPVAKVDAAPKAAPARTEAAPKAAPAAAPKASTPADAPKAATPAAGQTVIPEGLIPETKGN